MFLCMCKGVRVSEAVEAARAGATTPDSMIERFGFEDDECCGRCARDIDALVVLVTSELEKALLRSRDAARDGHSRLTGVRAPVLH